MPKIADAEAQHALLRALADAPDTMHRVEDLAATLAWPETDVHQMLSLLVATGLVEAREITHLASVGREWLGPRITARGLSHIGADGGLGAQLRTVTVTFDAETLRALLAERVEATPMAAAEKAKWRSWVKAAGESALKEAAKHLVEGAIRHWPDALQSMRTLLG